MATQDPVIGKLFRNKSRVWNLYMTSKRLDNEIVGTLGADEVFMVLDSAAALDPRTTYLYCKILTSSCVVGWIPTAPSYIEHFMVVL